MPDYPGYLQNAHPKIKAYLPASSGIVKDIFTPPKGNGGHWRWPRPAGQIERPGARGNFPHAPAPHSESTHGEECFYPSILDPRENWHNRLPTWYRAGLKYHSQIATIFQAISGRSGKQLQGQNHQTWERKFSPPR